jgi:glucokinase
VVASDQRTITRTFGKYDDAPDIDLEQWARDTLGLPLRIDNDARAAAVGEWLEGAGRGFDHLVMVTLGTGIGTAVISHGKPLWGQGGFAGNLGGHGSPRDGGRPCICGQNGCAEAHAASWALPGIASESPVFLQSSLSRAERIDYLAVFEQAALGDQLARELKENAYREWTLLLTRLTMQFDPECIVIGGGIMASGEILPTLQDRLARAVTTRHIVLRQSELGDAAALVGGAGFRTICNTSH